MSLPTLENRRGDDRAMLVIILMLAGFAVMFGDKVLAGKIVKGVVGVAVMLAAIPCVVRSCACSAPGFENAGSSATSGTALAVVLLAALTLFGFGAWRRRVGRAKTREIWARRHGNSRARSLPLAPTENQPSKAFPEK
jgi:hypothetical protein